MCGIFPNHLMLVDPFPDPNTRGSKRQRERPWPKEGELVVHGSLLGGVCGRGALGAMAIWPEKLWRGERRGFPKRHRVR